MNRTMKWNAGVSRCVDTFVLLLLLVRVVEQRLFDRPAASFLVDGGGGGDPGRRFSNGGAVVPPVPSSWETEEGDGEDGAGDRQEHRQRFKDELVRSIKDNILKSLGRTGATTAADGGGGGSGRRGSTPPGGHATADAGTEEVSVVQVKKIIAFSDIPVLTASENGTVEFLLRRGSNSFRIDAVDLHLRISARGGGGGGGGHRQRHHHHRGRTPSISVVHLTRPGDPFFHDAAAAAAAGQTNEGGDGEEGPLPIARSSVRTKASSGWQKVPLPSSVVQEVLDSNDPVLRLSYVCDQCEVLPSSSSSSSGTSQSSTHRKREEEGSSSSSSSNARKRHGHGLPYLTISTFDLAERK